MLVQKLSLCDGGACAGHCGTCELILIACKADGGGYYCAVTGGRTGVVLAPAPIHVRSAVKFFRITSTTCRQSSIDGHGALPLSRFERCFACVRLRHFRFHDRVVLLPRERLGDSRDRAAIRSTASVFP